MTLKGCRVCCKRLWNQVGGLLISILISEVFYIHLVSTDNVYLCLPYLCDQSFSPASDFRDQIFLPFEGLRESMDVNEP